LGHSRPFVRTTGTGRPAHFALFSTVSGPFL
jgi:hypothetical protein